MFETILHECPSLTSVLVGAVPLYVGIVRALRWRRYNAIHKKYQAKFERNELTPEEAQEIMHVADFYDMPMMMNYSLAFALFKTYAIPTISKILCATKEMTSEELISKRYADTELMIATVVVCPISGFWGRKDPPADGAEADPRSMIALARLNWLHSLYNIKNDDFLYTLSLFVLEPIKWAEKNGWRPMSPLEQHAHFIFWVEIGKRMKIEGIQDTLEEMIAWSEAYAEKAMIPAETNKFVEGFTTDELLFSYPEIFGIKKFGRRLTTCLLEERVRISMMRDPEPWYMHAIVRSGVWTLNFVQRWLCLPRSEGKAPVDMRPPKITLGECPRMRPVRYQARPWYKPESMGLGYLQDKLAVIIGYYGEMPGQHLHSGGYRLEEMGPLQFEKVAHETIMENAAKLQGYPVTGPWSSNWKQ
ncbi:hypothetical protein BDN72DRAFT_826158 [Pluteus cervinus]|uniref:Uncharacterized protein n=1 Tax=Pluteus cervinus TaxID=181527 RepID=A0ACD3AE53_9AGAR|nr:hypothetical protein BDN72DRAFT_826158 [Pluteus cervinus]